MGTFDIYIECLIVMSSKVIAIKRRGKKSQTLAYQFELTMEGTGASNEEAPPTNVRQKDLTNSQRLEAISILRVKYIDGCFKRGAIVDAAKRFNMARAPQFGDYGSG